MIQNLKNKNGLSFDIKAIMFGSDFEQDTWIHLFEKCAEFKVSRINYTGVQLTK